MLKSDATTLVLTNRQKVFWPEEGYTKGHLLDYYRELAPAILPYLGCTTLCFEFPHLWCK